MPNPLPPKISVIITTYNWPYALQAVLEGLLAQKTEIPFEIIIADDGSQEETKALITSFKLRALMPVLHIWQPDEGFRAAAVRNKAVLAARGEYLIFLDGDCIPRENFIKRHWQLAEHETFVVGNRILLNRVFTVFVLSEQIPVHRWSFLQWCRARLQGKCNRVLPFFSVPLGHLRRMRSARWQGAKGCNLALWKSDLMQVNGWEEKFVGWGYEDSDLVIRLIRAGIRRKEGRYSVPVIHLWHPENDRTREQHNLLLLQSSRKGVHAYAEKGLNQYEPIV